MAESLILLAANVLTFIGTVHLTYCAVNNRKILYGYSLFGALLTTIALFMFNLQFAIWEQYTSVAFGLGTFFYWLTVTCFKVRYR